jgi:hypothetical protein
MVKYVTPYDTPFLIADEETSSERSSQEYQVKTHYWGNALPPVEPRHLIARIGFNGNAE